MGEATDAKIMEMDEMTRAPERIWLSHDPENVGDGFPPPDLWEDVTWSDHKINDSDVEYRRATPAADNWRNDPAADERWCAGNDFALSRLCAVLKVDPDTVDWDGSDNGLQEEADALIWRILYANHDAAPAADDLRAAAKAIADHDALQDREYLSADLNEKLHTLRAALRDAQGVSDGSA